MIKKETRCINKGAQTYSDKVGTYFHLDRGDKTCIAELV